MKKRRQVIGLDGPAARRPAAPLSHDRGGRGDPDEPHARAPGPPWTSAALLLAAGAAVAGIGGAGYNALRRRDRRRARRPVGPLAGLLAPLAFGVTAALGLLLERQEQRERQRRRLRQRASVLERWLPRRRPRLDHIVLHV